MSSDTAPALPKVPRNFKTHSSTDTTYPIDIDHSTQYITSGDGPSNPDIQPFLPEIEEDDQVYNSEFFEDQTSSSVSKPSSQIEKDSLNLFHLLAPNARSLCDTPGRNLPILGYLHETSVSSTDAFQGPTHPALQNTMSNLAGFLRDKKG